MRKWNIFTLALYSWAPNFNVNWQVSRSQECNPTLVIWARRLPTNGGARLELTLKFHINICQCTKWCGFIGCISFSNLIKQDSLYMFGRPSSHQPYKVVMATRMLISAIRTLHLKPSCTRSFLCQQRGQHRYPSSFFMKPSRRYRFLLFLISLRTKLYI